MTLLRYEGMVTAITIPLALRRLASQPVFGLKQWQLAHSIIFKDIYPWAGKLRDVDIAKKTAFTAHEQIEKKTAQAFDGFRKKYGSDKGLVDGLKQLNQEQLAVALAEIFNGLNVIHAFREGNGRSLRTLCTALARRVGSDLEWARIADKKYEFDQACIAEQTGPDAPLAKLFKQIIVPLAATPANPSSKAGRRQLMGISYRKM